MVRSTGQSEEIRFTIDKSQCGQRLDIFLSQSDAAISRSHVKCVIEEGDVLVNGIIPKVSQRLKEGDVIITSATIPGASSAAGAPASNPFAGGGPPGMRR